MRVGRVLFLSLLVILLERRAALHLTKMRDSYPNKMGHLGHQVP
jgi:hypothetical protein